MNVAQLLLIIPFVSLTTRLPGGWMCGWIAEVDIQVEDLKCGGWGGGGIHTSVRNDLSAVEFKLGSLGSNKNLYISVESEEIN